MNCEDDLWTSRRVTSSTRRARLELVPVRSNHLSAVMPALVAGIHVFLAAPQQARRRWPGHARP